MFNKIYNFCGNALIIIAAIMCFALGIAAFYQAGVDFKDFFDFSIVSAIVAVGKSLHGIFGGFGLFLLTCICLSQFNGDWQK